MRLVCPYTELRPETRMAAQLSGLRTRFEPMTYMANYYTLMQRLWKRGETFILLEQDIVPTEAQFYDITICGHDWCGFPYQYASFGLYNGAGFTRFSGRLMAAFPTLITSTKAFDDGVHPPRHWCTLDGWMRELLQKAGIQKVDHSPPVRHLGVGSAHGCVEAREQQTEAGVR